MRHPLPSAQAVKSLQSATAQGDRGAPTRRIAASPCGGLRIASWLVLVTVTVWCSELAAETVMLASPPHPADDGLRSIEQLSVNIQPASGDLPADPAAAKFTAAGQVHHAAGTNRPWPLYSYWWEAPAVCHQPLYFEQVNLERHGYSCGIAQPIVSAAHFFGTIPALPYLMAAEPCRECVYTLGHDRPGSCAPFYLYCPPLSLRGAAAEAGVVTGLIFAIP
ncbi:MAG TPA: hypothetical protein PLF81_20435 [Candidatus Anammoximicrobium sp.]|nr:hypothetical protein [Candidatus Anammoximicrobium sp.]